MYPKEIRKLFNYNHNTGELTWKYNPDKSETWNAKHLNKPALNYKQANGSLGAPLNGTTISAHRVIWAWWYGEIPLGNVSHANGDKTDNRIANLRSYGSLADVL